MNNVHEAMQWIELGRRRMIAIWSVAGLALILIVTAFLIDPTCMADLRSPEPRPVTVGAVLLLLAQLMVLASFFTTIHLNAILQLGLGRCKWISVLSGRRQQVIFVPRWDRDERVVLPLDRQTKWVMRIVRWSLLWPQMIRQLTLSEDRPIVRVNSTVSGYTGAVSYDFKFDWFDYELAIELGVDDRWLARAVADAVANQGEDDVSVTVNEQTLGVGSIVSDISYEGP